MRSNAEVLVLLTATDLLLAANADQARNFVAIANHGGNPISVTIAGETPVVGRGVCVPAGSTVVLQLPPSASLKAIAKTAAQTANNGTSVSEW